MWTHVKLKLRMKTGSCEEATPCTTILPSNKFIQPLDSASITNKLTDVIKTQFDDLAFKECNSIFTKNSKPIKNKNKKQAIVADLQEQKIQRVTNTKVNTKTCAKSTNLSEQN